MKKLLAILLSALLLLPLGLALRSGDASAETEADLWAQIERYENDRLAARGVNVTTASADDYMSMTDGIVALVEAHESYAPGTLFLNGQSVFWHDTNGMGNGWVPNARQKQRANLTGKTPEEAASVETVSYASKGGSPNSSDVALFGPYYGSDSSFTNQYRNEANSIAQASGGVYRLYSGTAATIDAIAHELETSGIVIFDSHGNTDYSTYSGDYTSRANTSYLCLTSYEGLTNQDTATVQGTFGSYQHAFRSGNGAFVDGTAIANHMDGVAPNSLLWMAICLGMATDGMEAPLRAQGVEVVYGYSQSVSFTGDYKYEEYFWTKMKGGSEVQEAIAYMKNKVGVKDPYTNPPAYPIVVSSEDVYPGHGNVDAVQTVNSTWKLFADYTVTAVSNNTSYGTVSVSGTQITATPAAGYYVAGYQVISGTATATIDGNIINVTPTSDCTIKIIFAQKPTYTVSYQSLGQPAGSVSALIYDTVNLPASVSSVPEGWTFSGWTPAEVEETTTAPEYYAPGAAYTVTGNVTLYALFTRTEGTGNLIYRLVNDNLSDWSGNYIITCGKDTSALVLKGMSGSTSYESASAGGSVTFSSTGMTLDGEVIRNANNAYVFAIASSGAKYTIRNASTNTYVGSYNDYLYSRSSYGSRYCNWDVEYDLYNICMKVSNDASSSYPYLVKGSNSYFIVNSTYTANKTLFWKEELEGVVYYHTSPTATPTPPTPVVNESQYVLVETAPSDWSGQYLIVYKDGPYAMDGSLTTLDVASNYKTVDLSDKTITVNEDEDIFYFTIAKDGNNYTLQSASGYYIGRTNNTNGLNSNTNTKYTVSLSINEEQQANIVGSGGAYLRFNKNNGEKRFRFFRSSTYTNQQPVYLYKYVKPEPRFVTQNLILSGEIGVQFFVDVSMLSEAELSETYMTFTIDDKAGKDGETLKVTTVPYADAEGAANKRGFKFFVNAIQMADTITATLHYGDGQTIEKTYSVEQYIRDFEDNKAQYDNKTITLVEALCSYGYHVQQFLSAVNHWTLDTDYKAVYQSFNEAYDVNAVKTAAANNYRMTAETTGAFKAPGMSLVLDSETAIRIFLAHEDGSMLDAQNVDINVFAAEDVAWDAETQLVKTQKGNRVMVEIKGIKAAWLAETFTITAEEYDTDNTQTITVSALSYIDRLLGSEAYANNTAAQNAVCALYAYAMAARAYNN